MVMCKTTPTNKNQDCRHQNVAVLGNDIVCLDCKTIPFQYVCSSENEHGEDDNEGKDLKNNYSIKQMEEQWRQKL